MPVARLMIAGSISACLGMVLVVGAGSIQRLTVTMLGHPTSRMGRANLSVASSPGSSASTQFAGGLAIVAGIVLWIFALMDLVG